jgi:aspartate/methionine/tyrosine aminotransferase
MLHLVSAFSRIGEENAFAVLAKAAAIAATGREVINLGIGQPSHPASYRRGCCQGVARRRARLYARNRH